MPFCSKCGYKATDDALFCAKCGSRIEQITGQETPPAENTVPAGSGPVTDRFRDYLDKLSKRLGVHMEYSSVLDAYCVRNQEFVAWALSKYRYYIFIHHDDNATGSRFLAFADKCFEDTWNRPHQTGVAANQMVIPVLCQEKVTQQTADCLRQSVKQKHTFASGMNMYPVILELSTGNMFYPTDTPVYGFAVWPKLKKMCAENLYYYA